MFVLFCISENEATQLQSLSLCWFLKVLVLVLWNTPSRAQQPLWHCAVGCKVEAIEHWISPVCLSGRTPCAKCVCAVPLRKFNVQQLSEFLISYLRRRGSVAACWVLVWSTYRWSGSRFFKRHKGEEISAYFFHFTCISSLLKCIFCIISQIWHCSTFNVGRMHLN